MCNDFKSLSMVQLSLEIRIHCENILEYIKELQGILVQKMNLREGGRGREGGRKE